MGTDRMQMPRALITGATGFAGSHLADLCLASGWEVHGTSLKAPEGRAGVAVSMHQIDLSEPGAFERVLTAVMPDRIFHLAGQASVATAWADPAATLISNIVTTQRVLEAAHIRSPEAKLLIVSSGEVYGRPPLEVQPIREAQPLRPADPYAVSKVSVEYLALQHVLAFGMHVVRVRPFNHIGPRQRRGFVVADFAAQIAAIERGEQPPFVRVGNLQAARDFTDVRDTVRGYLMALEDGVPGEVYNVCSGRAVQIAELLRMLLAACTVPVKVISDPAKQRPLDTPVLTGSADALSQQTGWEARIPLDRTLADTLAYWRERSSPP